VCRYIKDYNGASPMHCKVYTEIDYTHFDSVIRRQVAVRLG
jgi:hypothetical protein